MKNVTGTTRRAMTDFDITSFVHELPGMAYRCQWNGTWSMEFVSLGCQTLTGYSCEQLIGETARPWNALIHPDDVAWVSEAIRSAIHGERPFQLVYRVHTRTGIERWVQEDGRGISMPGDDPFYLEGFVSDITARKHAERSLTDANATINRLIREDPLTGLANRRALEERIIPAMSYARRWEQPLSIIMADLDRFKNVNDKHGHLTGDQVLVSFAQRLQISCRIEDLLVRFGGEEFHPPAAQHRTGTSSHSCGTIARASRAGHTTCSRSCYRQLRRHPVRPGRHKGQLHLPSRSGHVSGEGERAQPRRSPVPSVNPSESRNSVRSLRSEVRRKTPT